MFIKSKYTIAFKASNKKSYIIFNSSSGSIAYLEDNDEIKTLKSLFKTGFSEPNSDLENTLVEEGYFVPDNIDEIAMVDKSREYYKEHSKHYELILYPTEECNFRCTLGAFFIQLTKQFSSIRICYIFTKCYNWIK